MEIPEKLSEESYEDYLIFKNYYGLGKERSLKRLSETKNINFSVIRRLSKKWNWQDRIADFNPAGDNIANAIKESIKLMIVNENETVKRMQGNMEDMDTKAVIDTAGKLSKILNDLYKFNEQLTRSTSEDEEIYKVFLDKVDGNPELEKACNELLERIAGK